MARPARICFPGALYHVVARGNARECVVRDDEDRAAFLEIVARVVDRYALVLYAYCLMDNHYHLAVETPLANLPRAMRQLNGLYATRFNRRHNRVGHVFQARYRAILVERETYLLNVCRYIVRNPLRVGICAHPADYGWSSYRQSAGLAQRGGFLASDALLALFGSERNHAQRSYRDFVAAADPDLEAEIVGERLGSQAFLATRFTAQPIPEVPRGQWATRPAHPQGDLRPRPHADRDRLPPLPLPTHEDRRPPRLPLRNRQPQTRQRRAPRRNARPDTLRRSKASGRI